MRNTIRLFAASAAIAGLMGFGVAPAFADGEGKDGKKDGAVDCSIHAENTAVAAAFGKGDANANAHQNIKCTGGADKHL